MNIFVGLGRGRKVNSLFSIVGFFGDGEGGESWDWENGIASKKGDEIE